jgi:rfaE bifunctional protein nucleotidyltransferase chain/domain
VPARIPPSGSVLSQKALAEAVAALRRRGRTVVWTNGCLDLLHAGHLASLEAAAALGDVLIAGVNADASVRALKGPGRPVQPQAERARLVAALRPVDYAVVFRGATPLPALKRIRPDVFAKGGDYTLETMRQDERRFLERIDARIAFLPFVPGCSTTDLVDRVRRRTGG